MSKPFILTIAMLLVVGCATGVGETDDVTVGDGPPDDVPNEGAYFDVAHIDEPFVVDPHAPTLDHVELVLEGELPAPRYISEAPACNAVFDAYHRRGLELGCATTTHVCPDLLRFPFGEACLLYYATTVENCEQRILAADTCQTLWTTSCGIQAVEGSAPLGCPSDP